MPSLNLSLDYFDHPKTKRLVAALGEGAELLPIRLWVYTAKFHQIEGVLQGYNAAEIENILGWKGNQGAAVAALLRVKFLDDLGGGFSVHDWRFHAGHFAMYLKKAQKMNAKRWGKSKLVSSKDAPLNPNAGEGSAVQGNAVQGKTRNKKPPKEKDFSPAALSVYSFYKESIKASTRKTDALKWIERRGVEVGFERLVMSVARYMLKCKERQTAEEYKKDCANFFGEDAAFEGFLPDDDFFTANLPKAKKVLGVENETSEESVAA